MDTEIYFILGFLICLSFFAFYQIKYKKPKNVKEVELEEKKKKEKYVYKLKGVNYLTGYHEEIENRKANLGIKTDELTYYQDVILQHEGWMQGYRLEEINIKYEKIIKVMYQRYEAITINEINVILEEEKIKKKNYLIVLQYINHDGISKNLIFNAGRRYNQRFEETLKRYLRTA